MEFIRFIDKSALTDEFYTGLSNNLRRVRLALIASLCLSLLAFQYALAKVPSPRIKPTPPNLSQHLSDRDAKLFRNGLRAAKVRKWQTVANSHKRLNDQTAKDILIWVRALRDPQARIEEMTYVTQTLSDWPRMTTIRAKAEARLFDRPLSAQATLNWFQGEDPVSGEGRIALARAYFKLGDKASGQKWLKDAWRDSRLTRDRQKRVYKEFKAHLSRADHAARADHLIWLGRRHFSKVDGLLSLMSPQERAVAYARMRVATNRSGMDAAVNAVPRTYRKNTGLLFERARWRRRKKSKEYALPVYLSIDTPPTDDGGKKRLWTEKKIMIYWAIGEKKFSDAYALTQNHGLKRGSEFAEAEFLAGWLALTKLNRANDAARHFETLYNGVTFPVSLSRASYWQARASERLGTGNVSAHYTQAAQFPNTYYGQLAAEKLDGQFSTLTLPPEITDKALSLAFESDQRVRAMHLLGEAHNERFFTNFAFHMDDEVTDLRELTLLSTMARSYGFMRPAIRAAKQASRFQSMLTQSGYPVIESINALPKKYDRPFVFAIARQESEFNYKAVSSAKAYGMMQMINGTARATARRHRIPYSRTRMTTDIDYSAKLGALHLQDLLKDFNGSYIMAAAGYNAGAHRVRQWIKAYGDPRKGDISPIDWIESLPFTETRNYVQRVMENMQVYKARLNGDQHPNEIYIDLTKGTNKGF